MLRQVKDHFLPAASSPPNTDTADQIKKHKFFHANYGAKGQFAQKHVKNVDFSNPVIALPQGQKAPVRVHCKPQTEAGSYF